MRGLAGRGILVSGGTSGIGRATAARFLSEGSRVFVTGVDADDLGATLALLGGEVPGSIASGSIVSGCVADVRDHRAATDVVARAQNEIGPLDVLVNNAGISSVAAFLDIDVDVWDQTIAVNLRGMFSMAQAFARMLVAAGRGGVIVNMASTNALGGEAGYAHYDASKGGVLQLTRTMSVELGPLGIRVNCLCPGYIDTPLNRTIAAGLGDNFAADYAAEQIPLGRVGTEDDVASAYAFLASDDAAFISGAALVVDGAQTAVM